MDKDRDEQWEQLLNLACHDRDMWQQQCETLETIVQKQRAQIRFLKGAMRDYVDLADKFRDEVLETVEYRPGQFCVATEIPTVEEAECETEGVSQAARDEGQDSGKTSGSGESGC